MADIVSGRSEVESGEGFSVSRRDIAPIPAISYIRVSGRGQIDGDGPERQDIKIGKLAERDGYSVVFAAIDPGVSGAVGFEDRRGLSSALEYLADPTRNTSGIRTILVEDARRLARDLIVQELTIKECDRLGIAIVGADDGNLTNDPSDVSRTLIRQILGAVSQWDKNSTVLKLRGARERIRARQGRCEGAKPYGEHPKHPEEVAVLRDILERSFDHNQSCREIAAALNEKGILSRKRKAWTFGTVAKILTKHRAWPVTGINEA
jgi:DNA invertase Pin-like site-specific DNA recombinase